MPTDRKPYLLRIDADLKERADKARGPVPFNAWVQRLIENACDAPEHNYPAFVASVLGADICVDPTPPEPPKPRFNLQMGRDQPAPGSMLKGMKKK